MKLQSHLGLVLLTHQAMKNSPAAYVEQKTIDRKSQTLVPWSPEEFPNPDLDQRACRTHLNRFCDPDGVLKDDSDVRSVEEHLARVRRFEPKCRHRGTQDDGPFDIQLGVALVDKMDLIRFPQSEDQEMIAAERFARKVHDSWGVGIQSPCGGTGALLFLSKVDRAVYISRGQALDPILTQYRIGRIVQAMKPLLQQEQYGKAILKGLEEIDSFIAEGPAHATEGSGETIMAASLFASCLGLFALAARRHRRNQRQYAEVSSHLNHLDEQRAQALQGQYKTTSCPICLEKFDCTTSSPMKGSDGLSVKLLRCGHVFDESCWSDWVNRGQAYDKCPICREDVKAPPAKETTATRPRDNTQHTSDRWEYSFPAVRDGQPASRSSTAQEGGRTMRLFLNERNFRISRLGSRYPNYIRPQQIRSWTSPTFTGPLARDPSFIRLDPAREMQNSTRQTHGGSGFGGGRSSGGGGGRW